MGRSLFVHSLRLGFATNSSSSHSLIFLPGLADDLAGVEHAEYHDEPFALVSRELKRPYLRLQLDAAGYPDALADELGPPLAEGQVNHQARWAGPRELLVEVARWALEQGVAILGGSDGMPHPSTDFDQGLDPADFGHCRVRRDPLGFWSVFQEHTGTKLRLSFAAARDPHVRPFRATWPELVDLKITDRCTRGCAYCYQDSRPDGAHAELESVLPLIARLAEAEVFEVVLGGGEPTEHPEFPRILAAVQQARMRVAFTTRSLAWIDRVAAAPAVKWDEVAWAYSADSLAEVRRVDAALRGRIDRQERPHVRPPAFHVVLGTPAARPESLTAIARYCRERYRRLVLLGYKRTGRGARQAAEDEGHWLESCRAAGPTEVAIDTALAARSELALQAAGVPEWLYEVEDGRFSMYVDGVRSLCGPSSYCEDEALFPVPEGPGAIERAFAEIDRRLGPSRRERALLLAQREAQRDGDGSRLVLLDAAMEGRCEACGAASARLVAEGFERPRTLCARCAPEP